MKKGMFSLLLATLLGISLALAGCCPMHRHQCGKPCGEPTPCCSKPCCCNKPCCDKESAGAKPPCDNPPANCPHAEQKK